MSGKSKIHFRNKARKSEAFKTVEFEGSAINVHDLKGLIAEKMLCEPAEVELFDAETKEPLKVLHQMVKRNTRCLFKRVPAHLAHKSERSESGVLRQAKELDASVANLAGGTGARRGAEGVSDPWNLQPEVLADSGAKASGVDLGEGASLPPGAHVGMTAAEMGAISVRAGAGGGGGGAGGGAGGGGGAGAGAGAGGGAGACRSR